MADAHKNFAYSTVAVAPSPASSGTTLTLATGDGALFPAVPFDATVWPIGAQPLAVNAEIVRVTAMSGDAITAMTRGGSPRSIVVGDQIAQTLSAAHLDQYLALSGGAITGDITAAGVNKGVIVKGSVPWIDVRHPDFNLVGGVTTTTGSISSGSPTLTIAASNSFKNGCGIWVILDNNTMFETTVLSGGGTTTLTLAANAPSAATAKTVGRSETAAIQAAIDYASSTFGSGMIYLPGNNYYISQIKLKNAVGLFSFTRSSILWSIPGNTANYMVVNNASSDANLFMKGLTVYGNKAASPAPTCGGIGIIRSGSPLVGSHNFSAIYVHDCKGDGIHLTAVGDSKWDRIFVNACDGHGMVFDGDTGGGLTGNKTSDQQLLDCEIGNSGLHGILDRGTDCIFIGCPSYWSGTLDTTKGNWFLSGLGTILSGCRSDDGFGPGIILSDAQYCKVDFSSVSNAGDYVQLLGTTQDCQVKGIATFSPRRTATSILNVATGAINNQVDIQYSTNSLPGATAPVIGVGKNNVSNAIHVYNAVNDYRLINVVIKTSGTSYVPSNGTRAIYVECIGGGGGGGGGATSSSQASVGGGGGGGAYAASFLIGAAVKNPTTYAVGAGGTAGSAGASGNAGGDTTWDTTVVVAKGGSGGAVMAAGTTLAAQVGANGGAAASCTGDLKVTGGIGDKGVRLSSTQGWSGNGGAPAILGAVGADGVVTVVGGPAGVNAAATAYGSGGGGGATLTTAVIGGTGAPGMIRIWEYA